MSHHESCVICTSACVKGYHCPRCAAGYCGVVCFRKHKENCSGAPAPLETPAASAYDEAARRVDAPQAAGASPPPLNDEGDDELDVLRAPHLSALANHPNLRNQLKSRELQKLIRIINNSRSRLDALEAALHNVPEFKEFADLILTVVHSCNERRRE
jgi:zinc finger HIT domain-containing protein 3